MPSFASGMLILVLIGVSKGTSKQLLCRWSIPTSHSHHLIKLIHKHTTSVTEEKMCKITWFFSHVKNTQFWPSSSLSSRLEKSIVITNAHIQVCTACPWENVARWHQVFHYCPKNNTAIDSSLPSTPHKCFHKFPKFTFRQLHLVFNTTSLEMNNWTFIFSVAQ